MKYTNKQRAEIYLDAIELIPIPINGCCWAIQEIIDPGSPVLDSDEIEREFPEFMLFQPEDARPCTGWWGRTDYEENQNLRILALLFAYQMAIDP